VDAALLLASSKPAFCLSTWVTLLLWAAHGNNTGTPFAFYHHARGGTHMISTKSSLFFADSAEVEDSEELPHIDSAYCWCDPIVAVDEFGQHGLAHKDVTWH
jgi:hypothetical protein